MIEELEVDVNERIKDLFYGVPHLDAIAEDEEQEAIGRTLLHLAAREGLLRVVRLLIQLGADLEARDAGSWTSLHLSCGHGHSDIVDALLESGADVNCQDEHGWAPLHHAVALEYADVVALLLEKGADCGICTFQEGLTPLELAKYLDRDIQIIQMIEDRMPCLPVFFCELCWEPGSGRCDVDEPETESAVPTDSAYLSGYDHRDNDGVCTVCHPRTQIWRHARIKWFAKRRARRTEDDPPSDSSQSSRPRSQISLSQNGPRSRRLEIANLEVLNLPALDRDIRLFPAKDLGTELTKVHIGTGVWRLATFAS